MSAQRYQHNPYSTSGNNSMMNTPQTRPADKPAVDFLSHSQHGGQLLTHSPDAGPAGAPGHTPSGGYQQHPVTHPVQMMQQAGGSPLENDSRAGAGCHVTPPVQPSDTSGVSPYIGRVSPLPGMGVGGGGGGADQSSSAPRGSGSDGHGFALPPSMMAHPMIPARESNAGQYGTPPPPHETPPPQSDHGMDFGGGGAGDHNGAYNMNPAAPPYNPDLSQSNHNVNAGGNYGGFQGGGTPQLNRGSGGGVPNNASIASTGTPQLRFQTNNFHTGHNQLLNNNSQARGRSRGGDYNDTSISTHTTPQTHWTAPPGGPNRSPGAHNGGGAGGGGGGFYDQFPNHPNNNSTHNGRYSQSNRSNIGSRHQHSTPHQLPYDQQHQHQHHTSHGGVVTQGNNQHQHHQHAHNAHIPRGVASGDTHAHAGADALIAHTDLHGTLLRFIPIDWRKMWHEQHQYAVADNRHHHSNDFRGGHGGGRGGHNQHATPHQNHQQVSMYQSPNAYQYAHTKNVDLFVAQLPFDMPLVALQTVINSIGLDIEILHAAPHYKKGRAYDGCAFVKVQTKDSTPFVTSLHKTMLFDVSGVWFTGSDPQAKQQLHKYCAQMQAMGSDERRERLTRPIPFSAMTAEIARRSYVF